MTASRSRGGTAASTRGRLPRETPDVYARLKLDISLGEVAAGTRLVETELAERYGVSRTPIRQALLALEQDGLVARDGRSLQVRVPSTTEITELYEVRELLEERATRLAARRHDEADAAVLDRLVAAMSNAVSRRDRYILNREFHTAIWLAAHQTVLAELLDRLYLTSILGLGTTLTQPGRWEAAIAEHRAMLDAILRRAEDEAAELVRTHLRTARDIRIDERLALSAAR